MISAPATAANSPTVRRSGFVLVGDDGTRYSRPALDFAVEEARRRRLPLSVVTIRRSVMVPGVSLTDQLREERSGLREAEHRLRASLAHARERYPEVAADGALLNDPEPQEVSERLRGAEVLVVGAHGVRGLPAFALGSPSMELAEAVSCPVVYVPDTAAGERGESTRPAPVVVGVGTGAFGARLVQEAAEEAARRSTGLVVVHGYRIGPGEDATEARSGAQADVRDVVLRAGADPRVGVTVELTSAPPAAALVEWSRRASLLLTGTRGLLALAGLTTGSVSRALLDSAACPVLVLLEPARRPVNA